ncbi:MAG: hypothetical protein PHX60_06260 [Giesbergeria sp.]|uniref:beta strand repeat-containing protein n=1 Tax=Giesbergeria sp. TaxID=2818473 RepID=UPI0026039860|nr:hypothetical protein [Giesbergeria sp.]MDD2609287.1 hypothetical protein [Giesbergeria sp.]
MQKIFRILMLMLVTALAACGGGGGDGGSPGANPNQTTLVTTAGTALILPVGVAREYQISGGVPPYRINNANEAMAEGQVDGKTLIIRTKAAGNAKVSVLDYSGASVEIDIQIGSSIPLYTTAPGNLTVGVGSSVARRFLIGGGAAPYTVEGGDSNVAIVGLIGANQLQVTGVAIGATTVKIRDAAGEQVEITLTVGSPELRISPTDLVIPVGLDAVAKVSGGQPPYRVAGGIPVAITATIQGDELHIKGSLASELEISVMDAAGQTVKVKVEINTATTAIRFSPSALVVSENDTQPIQFSVFGAQGATCVFTSDPSFLQVRPSEANCMQRNTVTLETGTRGSRCVNGNKEVLLTVVDAARSTGTAKVTIEDNGSCGNFAVLPASVEVRTGENKQLELIGGSGSYVVSSDNARAATATVAGGVLIVTGGDTVGQANITIRDQADTSKVLTVPVTVVVGPVATISTSPQTLNLKSAEAADVLISGGSGNFDLAVSNNQMVTAVLSGRTLRVVGGSTLGTATITIRDQADLSRTTNLSVTVTASGTSVLGASPATLTVVSNAEADVLISGGSGNFDLAVSNTQVATATLNGRTLRVTGGGAVGTATITVRDKADATRVVAINVTVVAGNGSLTASQPTLSLPLGAAADVLISGGSGRFDVAVNNTGVATAALTGNTLRITAGATAGTATITVRDQADQSKTTTVRVTVSAAAISPLVVSPSTVSIQPGAATDVLISGGSGKFDVAVSNTGVATAALTGNTVRITAGATVGTTTITVRDQADQSKIATITVTVSTTPVGALVASPSGPLSIQSGASADVLLSGGSGRFDFATSNSAVATATLAGNKLTITASATTGSATITVRDQADASRSVAINVNVTGASAPAAPMTAAPSAATGSVQETLYFVLQNGTAPYTVVVSNPSVATATVTGNTVAAALRGAGQTTLVVTDARGQTLNIDVTSNQAQQASLRFAPSAFEVGEDSLAPITLTVFGGQPPYRALTSDLGLSNVEVNGDTFTVGLGTRSNRCINPVDAEGKYLPREFFNVILTVVDSGGAFATSTMTIRDNGMGDMNLMRGTCPQNLTLFTTADGSTEATPNGTASILVGSSRTFSIRGGVPPYRVETSNSAVAPAVLSSQAGLSITGLAAGNAIVTIRDAAGSTSTIAVTVTP